jgi:hypothetical protein
MKGGRYLEAQMAGSRQQARDGHLVIITAGDRSLFEDCATCFSAMGVKSFHIGESRTDVTIMERVFCSTCSLKNGPMTNSIDDQIRGRRGPGLL